jgi:hypothetical protein
VTPEQAQRRLRSLRYRKRLQASTSAKEAELIAYLLKQGGEAVIDGYRVTLTNGRLSWERLPAVSSRQLPLFPDSEENGGEHERPL